MTLLELEENVRNLKGSYLDCNLFCRNLDAPEKFPHGGLYVLKKDMWKVYDVGERGSVTLGCVFYTECYLYEYVYCYFKKASDVNCWLGGLMVHYPQELIKKIRKFKIPESEYSFDGPKQNNCLYVEQNGDVWEVCRIKDDLKIILGMFYRELIAYDYLFYLVMKKHVDIKKRWW